MFMCILYHYPFKREDESMEQSFNDSITQFLKQRFRLLQVFRVKPFGEPVVDLRQQGVSFRFLALLLPETREAHGSAQFKGLRLLAARNLKGLVKTAFSLRLILSRAT